MKRLRVPLSYPASGGFDGADQATCRGGSFAVESVAAFAWNGWQASSGISGNLGLEYAPERLSTGKIHFHEVPNDWIASKCAALYEESPTDSLVIAPTKQLTCEINGQTQTRLNSEGQQLFPHIDHEFWKTDFRRGDPVLFTKNNYDIGVQNGSLGRLISVDQTEERLGVVKLADSGELIDLRKTELDTMDLGYAITLHKAQGSQVPRIIIALSDSRMVERSWLYTAITRSEAEVHIVGTKQKLLSAIRKESSHYARRTYLRDLLESV